MGRNFYLLPKERTLDYETLEQPFPNVEHLAKVCSADLPFIFNAQQGVSTWSELCAYLKVKSDEGYHVTDENLEDMSVDAFIEYIEQRFHASKERMQRRLMDLTRKREIVWLGDRACFVEYIKSGWHDPEWLDRDGRRFVNGYFC